MNGSRTSAEIVVVGAGIVGAASALRLALDGRRVAIVAPSPPPPGVASEAAGAMLGALGEVAREPDDDRSEVELDLRLRAAARYDRWLGEVAKLARTPHLRRGTFVVAGDERRSDTVAVRAIETVAAQHGLPCEAVDAREVPGLSPGRGHRPARTLFLPEEAWVDAPALLRSVLAAGAATGRVDRIHARVRAVRAHEGTVCGVTLMDGDRLDAEAVVVCAGAEAANVLEGLETHAGPRILRAKGVALCVERVARPLGGPPVTHALRTPNREFACGLHVVPRGNGLYLGSTNRLSRYPGMTGEVTAGEVTTLLKSCARELVADIPQWNITRMLFGHRPLAADGLPVVGATAIGGLFVATGTYRNGVLLAPLIADLLAAEMAGHAGEPLISPRPELRAPRRQHTPEILAAGFAQYAELMRDADDPPLEPDVGALLATLARLALGRDGESEKLRELLRDILDSYPLLELIPELAIEMCNPELLE